jgi:RNA polymerase sigma-70 factor, ECF subfamily
MAIATARRERRAASGHVARSDPQVDLMLRVQRDDAAAFTALVREYWPQVFGRFFRLLHDRHEAEDLSQEVFLRIYRHRKRYQPRAKFATWLFHIADNVARNALRTRQRHPCLPLDSLGPWDSLNAGADRRVPDAGESPSDPVERVELARLVRAAVSTLGNRQRTALVLFQFKERSCAEIAVEMSMTPKAAKSLLYRARNELRARLAIILER